MKKIALALLFLLLPAMLLAAEKTVQIRVTECTTWGVANKIRYILEKDEGVTAVDFPDTYLVDVPFDDTKTSADKIVASLKRAQLTVRKTVKLIEKKPNTDNDTKRWTSPEAHPKNESDW